MEKQSVIDRMAEMTPMFSKDEFLDAQMNDPAISQVKWALLANLPLGEDALPELPEPKSLWRQRQKYSHLSRLGTLHE